MRVLHHYWLSSGSRLIRTVLAEKNLDVLLKLEPFWERPQSLLALDPGSDVPVMVEDDGTVLCGIWAIVEYLEEQSPEQPLMPLHSLGRSEARRLTQWGGVKFEREVVTPILNERLIRRLGNKGEPSTAVIRAAMRNLSTHLEYFNYLADRRKWLAGSKMTIADLQIAASLSVVDFFGDVHWSDWPEVKTWYSRMKSRPSFRSLLKDKVTGLTPPEHYTNLDF
jgi:glutathione S-transferase